MLSRAKEQDLTLHQKMTLGCGKEFFTTEQRRFPSMAECREERERSQKFDMRSHRFHHHTRRRTEESLILGPIGQKDFIRDPMGIGQCNNPSSKELLGQIGGVDSHFQWHP